MIHLPIALTLTKGSRLTDNIGHTNTENNDDCRLPDPSLSESRVVFLSRYRVLRWTFLLSLAVGYSERAPPAVAAAHTLVFRRVLFNAFAYIMCSSACDIKCVYVSKYN